MVAALVNMNDEKIYYQSPIGILEIRTAESFLTHILFTNSYKGNKINEAEIVFENPKKQITREVINELNEYFAGNRKQFDIAIMQDGTPFQQSVWKELCNIAYGKTISYMDLSKRLGNPKAIRAVGTANGCNPISIIVPCHRVIGANGSLVGYGGDLWRKKWLLEHEAKFENGVQKLF